MRKITVSENKIVIEFSYDAGVVETVKQIPDRSYDRKTKVWSVPLSVFHAEETLKQLDGKGFSIDPRIYGLIAPVNRRKFTVRRDGLYDFQSQAIDFLNEVGGRALIADEQGLGKTIEALYWVSQMPDIKRVLVVCPASVLYKWKAEIEKWDTGKSVGLVLKGSNAIPDTNYVVMSYAIMTRQIVNLLEEEWDCFIMDEAHKVKSDKAQRSRAAKNINSKYFLALSGTPVLNRPVEFYNILNMIDPVIFGSWWTYVHRYCGAHQTYWGLDVSGASNLDELSSRLSPFMIRRLKKEVLTELPDLTRTKVPVAASGAEIVSAYRSLYEALQSAERGKNTETLVRLNVLRQAIGRAKIPFVVELAENVLESDEDSKVVIYAVHKYVVDELSTRLRQYGVTAVTGDIPNDERSMRCSKFQEMHMPRVMIISSAGGEGIDLYRSSVIIFAEREWGPATEEQAEARCHRIGQKNAVEAIYVVAQDTIDADIDDLIEQKRKILDQIVSQADVVVDIRDELFRRVMKGGG